MMLSQEIECVAPDEVIYSLDIAKIYRAGVEYAGLTEQGVNLRPFLADKVELIGFLGNSSTSIPTGDRELVTELNGKLYGNYSFLARMFDFLSPEFDILGCVAPSQTGIHPGDYKNSCWKVLNLSLWVRWWRKTRYFLPKDGTVHEGPFASSFSHTLTTNKIVQVSKLMHASRQELRATHRLSVTSREISGVSSPGQ